MSTKQPKNIFRILILVGAVISLYFVPWPIVTAWLAPTPPNIQKQVDKAKSYGFDGIVVCVNHTNNVNEFYTSGYKNRETKTPADPNALFKIASVGKLYTAVAITKLAHAGTISLDKTVADYFPAIAHRIENSDKINVRMLVQHRSGIPDYTRLNNYWAHPESTEKERLELVLDLPSNFAPDTDEQYSNTNYLLLGMLIEKVTGGKKFDYIQQKILLPLDLHDTYGSIKDVDLEKVMSGYYVGYDQDLKTDDNGLMLATAADLAKFIRALNKGDVFTDTKEQALYSSLYKFEHTGLIPGYQTIAKYHKDLDIVVIQFTNTVDFEGYNWNLSEIMYNRIMKILKENHS